MENKKTLIVLLVALVLVVGGYFVGRSNGYKFAQTDFKKAQEEAAANAAEQAAKSANPFQQVNPVEGVKSNPFADAKKSLNPFQ